jgi:ABC-type multidrug transport system ATPase subunit
MLAPDPHALIRTETPVERRFMATDLFLFRRTRGDFTLSLLMVGLVGLLIMFFPTETGWSTRKLPSDMLAYLAAQFGMLDPEGRVMRLGKILKQGWVAPLICLLILLPAAAINLHGSYRSLQRKFRQKVPWRWTYEMGQWIRALDFDDRIALLGTNGEGKSTLSKLIANRLTPIEGEIRKSGKLRIGFFAQHQLDELVPGETPLQHMARLRPDELPTKLRTRLSAAGIGPDIVENAVEKLSGGQKARLLMALAAIDAPHILILDEPTNHLDIESREALIHAINAYQGAVILVSHDPHLVETIADQLWIVRNGAVQPFDGDMDDYRKQLLQKRPGKGQTPLTGHQPSGTASADPLAQPARALSGRERRANTAGVRSAITKNEKDLE